MNDIETGFGQEQARISGIIERKGVEVARVFAERTLCIYHEAVSQKKHFASSRDFRGSFIGSILFLETFCGDVTEKCVKSSYSSRMCEHGCRGCTVAHATPHKVIPYGEYPDEG